MKDENGKKTYVTTEAKAEVAAMVAKTAVVACAVLLALSTVVVSESSTLSNQLWSSGDGATPAYSYNVSSCPGRHCYL